MPVKRKKSEGTSAENVTNAKKSKTQTKDKLVAAGGDDSDSDSSLDVDKWKKMVLQMTGRCHRLNSSTISVLSSQILIECC